MPDPATAASPRPASAGETLADDMRARLAAALDPTALEVVNDSHLHAGHAGDDGSGVTHWTVRVEAPTFTGLSRVARHRMVNLALAPLIGNPIHALSIDARAPGEAAR